MVRVTIAERAKLSAYLARRAARGLYGRLTALSLLRLPFIPGKASSIWEALGASGRPGDALWGSLAAPPTEGLFTRRPETLFPKPANV